MNKMGFNVKMGGEGLLYTILLVMLFLFIFNMSDIYQFVSKVKTGELFSTKKVEEIEEEPAKNNDDDKTYKAVKPEGADYVVCTKSEDNSGGTLTSTIRLYYTDFKLKSITENLKYDGISDEYMNYIYSENSKFKKRQTANKDLEGYSVIPESSSQTNLEVNSVYVLSKVALADIKLDKKEKLDLAGIYNQNTTDATQEYVNLGFTCEW